MQQPACCSFVLRSCKGRDPLPILLAFLLLFLAAPRAGAQQVHQPDGPPVPPGTRVTAPAPLPGNAMQVKPVMERRERPLPQAETPALNGEAPAPEARPTEAPVPEAQPAERPVAPVRRSERPDAVMVPKP